MTEPAPMRYWQRDPYLWTLQAMHTEYDPAANQTMSFLRYEKCTTAAWSRPNCSGSDYATAAERCDLEAALDRHPDGVTHELRSILIRQSLAAQETRFPAIGRS